MEQVKQQQPITRVGKSPLHIGDTVKNTTSQREGIIANFTNQSDGWYVVLEGDEVDTDYDGHMNNWIVTKKASDNKNDNYLFYINFPIEEYEQYKSAAYKTNKRLTPHTITVSKIARSIEGTLMSNMGSIWYKKDSHEETKQLFELNVEIEFLDKEKYYLYSRTKGTKFQFTLEHIISKERFDFLKESCRNEVILETLGIKNDVKLYVIGTTKNVIFINYL